MVAGLATTPYGLYQAHPSTGLLKEKLMERSWVPPLLLVFTKRIYLGVYGCWVGNHPTSAWNLMKRSWVWLLGWQPPLLLEFLDWGGCHQAVP